MSKLTDRQSKQRGCAAIYAAITAISLMGAASGVAAARAQVPVVEGPARTWPPNSLLPLHTQGNTVRNSRDERVLLRGVDIASLEWSSTGEGHVAKTVETAIRDWHVNVIRLPLTQDRWFGKAPDQKEDPEGKAYQALVKRIVNLCAEQNCYVLLDLHWSDEGEWGKQIGQHLMPDENSVAFWKDCAADYKNLPNVLFDLYNEPHDTTWDIWRDGGTVAEKIRPRRGSAEPASEKTYKAAGLQTLLDTVRATGAMNIVVAGGLDWSYDMSGFLNGKALSDPKGHGVIYANHAYPFKGDTVEKWAAKMEIATKTLPVIISEFGAEPGRGGTAAKSEVWVRSVLQEMHDHGWNWTAWDLHPSAGPTLISDWNYTPTPYFGVWVQQALLNTLAPYTPPAPPTAVPTTSGVSAAQAVAPKAAVPR